MSRARRRSVGDQQGRAAATDKNQFSENRPQQLSRIRQRLKIRIGHESTLACALNRVRPDFARVRVHPESHLPVPEAGRGRDRAMLHAGRFIERLKPHAPSIAVMPGPNRRQVAGDSNFAF